MRTCAQCTTTITDDAAFCPECGTRLPEVPVAAPAAGRSGASLAVKATGGVLAAGLLAGGGWFAANQLNQEPAAAPAASAPAPSPSSSATSSSTAAPTATQTVTTAPSPTASASAPSTPGRAEEVVNTSGDWKTVTYGRLTFDLPPGYTAYHNTNYPYRKPVDKASQAQQFDVQILDENGKPRALGTYSVGTEYPPETTFNCTNPATYHVLDTQTLPQLPAAPDAQETNLSMHGRVTPRFTFRATEPMGSSSDFFLSGFMGITDRTAGQNAKTCAMFGGAGSKIYDTVAGASISFIAAHNGFGGDSPVSAARLSFSSLDEAEAYMQTEEYRTLKRMLTSVQFQ